MREIVEHRLQERQLHLERMLERVRGIARRRPAAASARGDRGLAIDRRPRRAASRTRAPTAARGRGPARDASGRAARRADDRVAQRGEPRVGGGGDRPRIDVAGVRHDERLGPRRPPTRGRVAASTRHARTFAASVRRHPGIEHAGHRGRSHIAHPTPLVVGSPSTAGGSGRLRLDPLGPALQVRPGRSSAHSWGVAGHKSTARAALTLVPQGPAAARGPRTSLRPTGGARRPRRAAPQDAATDRRRRPRDEEIPERPVDVEDRAQEQEGERFVRRISRDELRQEREEEKRHFRVQDVGEKALREDAAQRCRRQRCVSACPGPRLRGAKSRDRRGTRHRSTSRARTRSPTWQRSPTGRAQRPACGRCSRRRYRARRRRRRACLASVPRATM